MSKKIIGVVLIVVGVITAFLGVKAVNQNPEKKRKIKSGGLCC